MSDRKGFTLVEVMVVIAIGILILIPTINFLVGTTKLSFKGYDRLDNLNTARLIMTRSARDLKFLCVGASFPALIFKSDKESTSFVFPSFPSEGPGMELEADLNPVNIIVYSHIHSTGQLIRTVFPHPKMVGEGSQPRMHELGRNVIGFAITGQPFWGGVFQIRVLCAGLHPQRLEPVELQTSVRPIFATRALQHQFQVPNIDARPDFPSMQ